MNNYKLLRPLYTLLQTRSLTESAKRLNVTQSAMSRTLTQIRTAFNDPMLIREGNQFVVSEKGKKLLKKLPSILATLDDLYDIETFSPKECTREFALAYTAFLSESMVPVICKEIVSQAPNASLYSQLWQEENIQTLSEGKIELVASHWIIFLRIFMGKN